jgi:hypothetical protein
MRDRTYRQRGQSFTELAIFMPILILLLAGMVEVVFLFNDYLQMLDAARGGSREASDIDPYPGDLTSFGSNEGSPGPSGAYDDFKYCSDDPDGSDDPNTPTEENPLKVTQNFFRRTACNTNDGLGPLELSTYPDTAPTGLTPRNCAVAGENIGYFNDDIVVSVFAVATTGAEGSETLSIRRYDNNTAASGVGQLVGDGGQTIAEGGDFNQSGWSFMQDQFGVAGGGMCSTVTINDIENRLNGTNVSLVPNTGFILVEVFITHEQILHVPGLGDLVPNPIPVHSYAIFPLLAAEPTPTP